MNPPTSGPPPLKRMIVPALFVGALFLVVFLRQPNGPEPSSQWVLTGQTMGTAFTVKIVVPPGSEVGQSEVEGAIRDAVDAVDFVMSTYRDDSELSRFNRHGTEPFEVSESMVEVVSEAQRIADLSAGAFDITVGPLVDAWGFGPVPVAHPPDADTIAALLSENGYHMLEVDFVGDREGLRRRSGDPRIVSARAERIHGGDRWRGPNGRPQHGRRGVADRDRTSGDRARRAVVRRDPGRRRNGDLR